MFNFDNLTPEDRPEYLRYLLGLLTVCEFEDLAWTIYKTRSALARAARSLDEPLLDDTRRALLNEARRWKQLSQDLYDAMLLPDT